MSFRFVIEVELEEDGRWIAEILGLPGVMTYGATEGAAVAAAEALALRVIAERLEHGAVAAAIDRALAAQAAEVTRYRAGEKKLFGLLVGAAMREAKGADAALVRRILTEKLG